MPELLTRNVFLRTRTCRVIDSRRYIFSVRFAEDNCAFYVNEYGTCYRRT